MIFHHPDIFPCTVKRHGCPTCLYYHHDPKFQDHFCLHHEFDLPSPDYTCNKRQAVEKVKVTKQPTFLIPITTTNKSCHECRHSEVKVTTHEEKDMFSCTQHNLFVEGLYTCADFQAESGDTAIIITNMREGDRLVVVVEDMQNQPLETLYDGDPKGQKLYIPFKYREGILSIVVEQKDSYRGNSFRMKYPVKRTLSIFQVAHV